MIRQLKRLVPERMKHLAYRVPLEHAKRMASLGPDGYFLLDRWAAAMEASVATLPSVAQRGDPLDLWFLTGGRFWYQTAYCAWTFAWHAQREVRLHLVDDGSLQQQHVMALQRLFGPVDVTTHQASVAVLQRHLPASSFPALNLRWNDYVHIRKLTGVHAGRQGRRLVLDSDMLFFACPTELLAWMDQDDAAPLLYMTDCEESYGYSPALLQSLAGAPLPRLLNVGVCGMASDGIDWSQLERWTSALVGSEGTSYFLEQALVALIAAQRGGLQLPAADYITLPTRIQVHAGAGSLQHYVASSKALYFKSAWRVARQRCGLPATRGVPLLREATEA